MSNPIVIGVLVGLGIVAGWHITTWLQRFMDWLERRR
jgi:hypothetical protein